LDLEKRTERTDTVSRASGSIPPNQCLWSREGSAGGGRASRDTKAFEVLRDLVASMPGQLLTQVKLLDATVARRYYVQTEVT